MATPRQGTGSFSADMAELVKALNERDSLIASTLESMGREGDRRTGELRAEIGGLRARLEEALKNVQDSKRSEAEAKASETAANAARAEARESEARAWANVKAIKVKATETEQVNKRLKSENARLKRSESALLARLSEREAGPAEPAKSRSGVPGQAFNGARTCTSASRSSGDRLGISRSARGPPSAPPIKRARVGARTSTVDLTLDSPSPPDSPSADAHALPVVQTLPPTAPLPALEMQQAHQQDVHAHQYTMQYPNPMDFTPQQILGYGPPPPFMGDSSQACPGTAFVHGGYGGVTPGHLDRGAANQAGLKSKSKSTSQRLPARLAQLAPRPPNSGGSSTTAANTPPTAVPYPTVSQTDNQALFPGRPSQP